MKYHNLKVRKVRRTLGLNLEPPEPFDYPQKPNLEPTEPPKMAEPRTLNQVRSKSNWNLFHKVWCLFNLKNDVIG